ncbi:MAG: sigma-54-dependent Fis family transcriptional regulator [Nitrospirae bacterium]|nr:sigma-54-dependent Fis family transcriptional regulator [Nitrospirota bacterium]MBF0535666.1 sigma-54-dependent Fis family transcriptional regulator [Nitrospirota bacterium]MBF0616972.1 sigma-54-dependent Fis family transcriptional regulator [Nitrospirota bacterium]
MSKGNYRVLIVDDEESIRLLLLRVLEDEGYTIKSASNGIEAISICENYKPNLILLDLKMPQMDGLTFIEKYKQSDFSHHETDFIVLTAYGTVDSAVKAMKLGAMDFITKPLSDPNVLRFAVAKAYELRRLLTENEALRTEQLKGLPPLEIIFGGMEDILEEVTAVSGTNSAVLLTGETGTGKTLIARVLHALSKRGGPFIELNCAAIPENLMESELFGYEKGAFTGAVLAKRGKFELASGGSILLDEVSEMSQTLQAKFLKVLEGSAFERLGGTVAQKVDARIICATNRDLQKEVAKGNFRQDLYFRLNVFPISIPPLRTRKTFIAQLCRYMAASISKRIGKDVSDISKASIEKLTSYEWPGNVRELQNVIERSIIMSKGGIVDFLKAIPAELPESKDTFNLIEIERSTIENALKHTGGNRKETAAMLGISMRTLQYKVKEYGLK